MSQLRYENTRDLSKEELRQKRREDLETRCKDFDEETVVSFLDSEEMADDFLDANEITGVTMGHTFHSHLFSKDNIHYGLSCHFRMLGMAKLKHGKDIVCFDKEQGGVKFTELFHGFDNATCDRCGKHFSRTVITEHGKVMLAELLTIKDPTAKPFGTRYEDKKMEECEYKDGFPAYSVELAIPSGKMALANHFAQQFTRWEGRKDEKYKEENSINYVYGRKRCTELAAERNFIDMNIGNCACDMFQVDETKEKFIVGAEFDPTEYGDYDAADHKDKVKNFVPWNYKQVGDVCTDYWGYYIVDADELKKRGCELVHCKGTNRYTKKSDSCSDVYIVKCVPGIYRFTHRYHLTTGYEAQQVYTTIERVGI